MHTKTNNIWNRILRNTRRGEKNVIINLIRGGSGNNSNIEGTERKSYIACILIKLFIDRMTFSSSRFVFARFFFFTLPTIILYDFNQLIIYEMKMVYLCAFAS